MSQPANDPTIDPAADTGPDMGSTPAPAPAPTLTTPAAPATGPSNSKPDTGDTTDWKAEAEKWKELARKHEERGKVNLAAKAQAAQLAAEEARQQVAQELGRALGLIDNDTPPDPAELARQAQEYHAAAQAAQEEAIAAQVELQVYQIAHRLGANPEKLLDSRAICNEIDNLEPESEADFAIQVEAIVKGHLEKNPSLRATGQAPARQGADISGNGARPPRTRPTGLYSAIGAAYGRH